MVQEQMETITKTATINPYIGFNGRCEEAMNFYKECFGGELTIMHFSDSPMGPQTPPESKNKVMHSMLASGDIQIMASDMSHPEGFIKGNNMSISLNCTSMKEMQSYFNSLSEGGKVIEELKLQFWGGWFGVVLDQFGMLWMLNLAGEDCG